MSDSINNNYSQYAAQNTSKTKGVDMWFEDSNKNDISVDSFLQLMIAQLKNQDFNNPVDDAQYLTQLSQFASMQQMQELAYYSKSNYVMGMLGKEVTAAKLSLGGVMNTVNGVIEKISLIDNEFTVFVNGEMFKLDQIMEVKAPKEETKIDKEDEIVDEESSVI